MNSYLIHQGHELPIMARATEPEPYPGYGSGTGWDWWVMEQSALRDEQPLTPRTALSWTPVFACIRYISSTLSSLHWNVFQLQPDGRTKLPIEENISWTLDMQANPEMTAFSWREVMLKDALTWGNGYAEIERNNIGKPMWLWRVDPSRVTPWRDDGGPLYYIVTNQGQDDTYIDAANMFHLKALGEDGLVGLSPISLFRRAIMLGVNQQAYSAAFFRRGPTPGGILKLPGAKNEKQDVETRQSFERTYGGSANAGRVIVLRGGAEFTPLSFPNDDAQLIEAMEFSGFEVARIYGVPPHKIGIMTAATNANITQQSIEAVQDCLLPWARRLETEADIKLFGRVTQGRRTTTISLEALTRGDVVEQSNALRAQVVGGFRTLNEARHQLDLNPIPDGDVPIIQGAMVTLEKIINPPAPAPVQPPAPAPDAQPSTEPAPGEEDKDEPTDEPIMDELQDAFITLLADCYGWFLAIETERATKQAKNGNLESWADKFFDAKREAEIAPSVERILSAFLIATRRHGSPEEIARKCAADHVGVSRRVLTDGLVAAADWTTTRARRQAERHIAMASECLNGVKK